MGDEEENMLQNVDFEAIITVYVRLTCLHAQ